MDKHGEMSPEERRARGAEAPYASHAMLPMDAMPDRRYEVLVVTDYDLYAGYTILKSLATSGATLNISTSGFRLPPDDTFEYFVTPYTTIASDFGGAGNGAAEGGIGVVKGLALSSEEAEECGSVKPHPEYFHVVEQHRDVDVIICTSVALFDQIVEYYSRKKVNDDVPNALRVQRMREAMLKAQQQKDDNDAVSSPPPSPKAGKKDAKKAGGKRGKATKTGSSARDWQQFYNAGECGGLLRRERCVVCIPWMSASHTPDACLGFANGLLSREGGTEWLDHIDEVVSDLSRIAGTECLCWVGA